MRRDIDSGIGRQKHNNIKINSNSGISVHSIVKKNNFVAEKNEAEQKVKYNPHITRHYVSARL